MNPKDNKFHKGNGEDGKHYWLTPPVVMQKLQLEFDFDFDPCPFPKPEGFDGLTCEWGNSNYVNPPFGSIMHQGPKDKKPKKKGMTAWVRKAIEENKKGKRVVMVYPIDKWVLMLVAAGAQISNLGDIKWIATEDGSEGKGTGRHIAQFVLDAQIKTKTISIHKPMPSFDLWHDEVVSLLGVEFNQLNREWVSDCFGLFTKWINDLWDKGYSPQLAATLIVRAFYLFKQNKAA